MWDQREGNEVTFIVKSKFAFIFLFLFTISAWGQSSKADSAPQPTPTPVSTTADDDRPLASDNPVKFLRNLAIDQKDIWTSPLKVRTHDLNWLVPMAGLTAGLINADAELSSRVNPNESFAKHSSTIANGGLGVALGGSAGMYLLGKIRADDHQKETEILASEAVANGYVDGLGIVAVDSNSALVLKMEISKASFLTAAPSPILDFHPDTPP